MTICTTIPLLIPAVLLLLLSSPPAHSIRLPPPASASSPYARAPNYVNHHHRCSTADPPLIVHVATTLDFKYLRGSMASVNSILKNAACPENTRFHFIATVSTASALAAVVRSAFPNLHFKTYPFANETAVARLISRSIRPALESPLNYARMYLAGILDPSVTRVVYIDSDTIVLDDIAELYSTALPQPRVIAAPEYCHANFTKYFNARFWSNPVLSRAFEGKKKKPCYFNTGVMVMDLERWRRGDYTKRMEEWMQVQREKRIYELGSLPPFLVVFGGEIEGIDHRWNQHGLGGDNVVNSCRPLHLGRVSLMHWSGKGKPWVRLDEGRPCAVDHMWKPYDLLYKA